MKSSMGALVYDPSCRRCERLASFLDAVKAEHPTYFCKPVPPFGSDEADVLVVGLAPGLHGANATGRPFTGDWCSDLLYGTLHRFGFASLPQSIHTADGQELIRCRVTNAVKCLPPANKPTPAEVTSCSTFLAKEIEQIQPKVLVCLGAVAHQAVLRCLSASVPGIRASSHKFGHGAQHQIGQHWVIDSYHPSRYNTNTGRLTPAMFDDVFRAVKDYVQG